jgi:hypothetical protein
MKRQRRWTVQTFLRLRDAGYPVRLSGAIPDSGVVVFHAGQKKQLYRDLTRRSRAVLVGIRGDRREALIADFEVLQNGRLADGRKRFFVPYWPQPGLLPRDASRGTTIRQASFKGFDRNLHPDLRGARWHAFLGERGITWEADSMDHSQSERGELAVTWQDYRDVDLIVALRPYALASAAFKPATKLYNAWHAGVPALLGPEYAFREVRRTADLDYLEIRSLDEACAAVDRLLGDPSLYRAMVDNGRRRAREFTVEAVTARWAELLFDKIRPELERRERDGPSPIPLGLRLFGRRIARLAARRPAR